MKEVSWSLISIYHFMKSQEIEKTEEELELEVKELTEKLRNSDRDTMFYLQELMRAEKELKDLKYRNFKKDPDWIRKLILSIFRK